MSLAIRTEADLAKLVGQAADRLGLEIQTIQEEFLRDSDEYLSLAAVRSRNDQLVTYPIVAHEFHRDRLMTYPAKLDLEQCGKLQRFVNEEIKREKMYGPNIFIFDLQGELIRVQRGITYEAIWSEIFALTSIFENVVRGELNLPLGTSELVEEDWLVANFDAPLNLDMKHPYLHLFAHEPRYRVLKLTTHKGFVALSRSVNLKAEVIHAIDYLEGVINE